MFDYVYVRRREREKEEADVGVEEKILPRWVRARTGEEEIYVYFCQ